MEVARCRGGGAVPWRWRGAEGGFGILTSVCVGQRSVFILIIKVLWNFHNVFNFSYAIFRSKVIFFEFPESAGIPGCMFMRVHRAKVTFYFDYQ